MRLVLLIVACFTLLCLPLQSMARVITDTTILPADAQPKLYCNMLTGKRVALVINQTAMLGDSSLLDVLIDRKINVRKIFVPEHGFRGKEDAGAHIDDAVDSETGLRIVSLYGKHKKPTIDDMKDIDAVVYDLQDVGVRFYTYISTLQYCMEACAEQKKQLIILDRPNPNGFYVDGPVLDTQYRSFVGMQPIPVVYGMTAGEYAMMLKGEEWISAARELDLKVIPCSHYTHSKKYVLPVAPSPNLRNMAAVYAYPSLCLFEGTKISVGRGTDKPFQQFGCPEFAGRFTYSFIPSSGPGAKNPPYENKFCYGGLIGVEAGDVLDSLNDKFQIKWLLRAYSAYPEKAQFFNDFFNKLSGSGKLREQLTNGEDEIAIRRSWQKELSAFKKIRKKYLLYKDF